MQNDIGRDLKFLTLMIAGAIHEQQDELASAQTNETKTGRRNKLVSVRLGRG
jgi:hypothetical protein